MAKKEVRTDLWVYDLLKQANIILTHRAVPSKKLTKLSKLRLKKERVMSDFPNM